jgi:hypothetical protein
VLVGKSLDIERSSHVQTSGLRIEVSIFKKKIYSKKAEETVSAAPKNSGFTRWLKAGEEFHSNRPPPHPPPANYPIIIALITNLHQN